jgi:hypothetical protein
MAPARVHAKLDINATDFTAMLLESILKLNEIHVTLKKLRGIEVVRRL